MALSVFDLSAVIETKGYCKRMSLKGNCLDNAVKGDFFGLLKIELLYLRDFSSIEELMHELDTYKILQNWQNQIES